MFEENLFFYDAGFHQPETATLDSGINVAPGTFGKNIKRSP